MAPPDDKKSEFTTLIAQHLIAEGMSNTGIRTLARVAGTSDRMLIYYFSTKEKLIEQSLDLIVGQLAAGLDAAMGTKKRSAATLLQQLTVECTTPSLLPTMRLWFEIVGLAARGVEPYQTKSRAIAETWIAWMDSKLQSHQALTALEIFSILEGRLLLHIIGISRK
jgi:AcrR family transcriptional regulator